MDCKQKPVVSPTLIRDFFPSAGFRFVPAIGFVGAAYVSMVKPEQGRKFQAALQELTAG